MLGLDREASVADVRRCLLGQVFIEAVARDGPTMLVFETCTGRPEPLDLIELLAARLRDLPILLLALARPELLDARPSWGGGCRPTRASADQLKESEARELAIQLLGKLEDRGRASGGTARRDRRGNPLFIEQLVAA